PGALSLADPLRYFCRGRVAAGGGARGRAAGAPGGAGNDDASPASQPSGACLLTSAAPAELVAEVESVLAEIRPPGYRMAAIALANADTRDVHATVSVPTLVIAGDHDQITPAERARELHAAIPGSRLVIIE